MQEKMQIANESNIFHPAAKRNRILNDKSSEFILPKFAEVQTEEIEHSATKEFLQGFDSSQVIFPKK